MRRQPDSLALAQPLLLVRQHQRRVLGLLGGDAGGAGVDADAVVVVHAGVTAGGGDAPPLGRLLLQGEIEKEVLKRYASILPISYVMKATM